MKEELTKLIALLEGSVQIEDGKVIIKNKQVLQSNIHRWVEVSATGSGQSQGLSRFLIRKIALELGIFPASIHDLYIARGRAEIQKNFTVPALNLRVMAFDAARAVFKAANLVDGSAIIFEIARSEIGYSAQRPAEYATNILAAAIAEGYRGPVFIQGDHFQVSSKRYTTDPTSELGTIKDLIIEAMASGFYNIDIDTSTMVDVTQPEIKDQQKLNIELSVLLAAFIREKQPAGVTISIGGEIGEVGGKNSTEEELVTYLQGFNAALTKQSPGSSGLSKISIQTGTSHGGVVLPDGSIAKVSVDFDTLRDLSRVSRSKFGLGGTVQHGASTLPEEAFGKFVESEAVEVHLATNFMNIFYDHIPNDLRTRMYQYLKENHSSEFKTGMTDEQFYYKTRKNAIGPFKKDIVSLPIEFHEEMQSVWKDNFLTLFKLFKLDGTKTVIDRYIHPVLVKPMTEDYLGSDFQKEDVSDLAD